MIISEQEKNRIRKLHKEFSLIKEQEDDFVCDRCRWNGVRTYMVSDDNKQTGDIKLELSLHNHTGNDTDRIERFEWAGGKSEERKGYRELEGKARNSNKKYNIDIEIPELSGFMGREEEEVMGREEEVWMESRW